MTGNDRNDKPKFKAGDRIRHKPTGFEYEVIKVTESGCLRVKWIEEDFDGGFIAARRLNEYEVVDAKAEATV
jgi:hypothetical protein